ncbi:PAS domain S-box protein [Halorubrum sp. HHNYT27]|uniref:PAS domain S-box protein n=1 Tax=Halorubrum sp. HHNYT27 TaxID=3402275 RepID=UPI003EC0712C
MPGPIRVLHVDDDPEFVELAAELTERQNESFVIETATSVREAMEKLPGEFDCVVSDYNMAETNGIEFLELFREEYPNLPFILYTGNGSEEVASEAISAGVTEYLQKSGGVKQYGLLAKKIENATTQYRSKRSLEASQKRLSLFIDQSPLGVIEWSMEFTVMHMNEAAEKILGYDEAELVDQSWETLVPESDQMPVEAVVSKLRQAHGGYHSTNKNVRKNGEEILCEWHNRVVTDDGEVVAIFSQFQDVTERHRQRQELELQADLFEKAQAIAQVGAWEWDLRTGDCFGTSQAAEITGLPAEFTIESPEEWLPFFHSEDRSRLKDAFEHAVSAGEEYDVKVRVIRSPDDLRWVRVRGEPQYEDGEPIRIRGTMQDITEENEREFELRETNQLLSTLFKTTPVGVAVLDPSGAITRANKRAEEVLGLTESDLIERTYNAPEWEIHDENGAEIPPEELPFSKVMETCGPVYDYEHGIKWPSGRDRWLSINAAPVTNRDGEIEQVITTVNDTTEAREFKLRVERKNQQLEEFARIVSHDLRNPLTVAQGRLELARDDHDNENLESVSRAHERMRALIEDLLKLAQEGKSVEVVERVDLDQLGRECWETVDSKGATLDADSGLLIKADRSRLRQLIENLFRNAIEHGEVDVTISMGPLETGFYIEDDGPGIADEISEDVFSAGFSTASGGTGYGLSIVKGVVDAHGWEIRLTDGPAGGARFEITGVDCAD